MVERSSPELTRCIEFLVDLAHRAAQREVPSPLGVALLHDQVPRVWSRNYFLANTALADTTADVLAAETERLLGGAGLRHRKLEVFDEEIGTRLEPGFRRLGWEAECDVVMVARREPDREVASTAEEVSPDDLEPIWNESNRDEHRQRDEDVVRQLARGKRLLAAAIGARFFAARVDGEIGSYCELYCANGTGQIENVLTLERYRNRGLARATTTRALAESQAAGNDLTFLVANRDDWPKELYEKLGFEEVGAIWDFTRPPRA